MPPKIVSIVGFSNSGKTTLILALIPALKASGRRIGTIKHAAHGFDMDRAGKDSHRHKNAGADAVVAASPARIALVKDVSKELSPAQIVRDHLQDMDLVLVEGYKREDLPKIETLGFAESRKPLFAGSPLLLATVGASPAQDSPAPHFTFDQAWELADFLEKIL